MRLRGNSNLIKATAIAVVTLLFISCVYFIFVSLQSQDQENQDSSVKNAYIAVGTKNLTKSEFEDMIYFMRYYEKKTELEAKEELVKNLKYIEAAKKLAIIPDVGAVASDIASEFLKGTYKTLERENPWPSIVAQKKAIDNILASTNDFISLHADVYKVSFTQNMKLEREDLLKNGYTDDEQSQIDKDKEYALKVANKIHDDLTSGVSLADIKKYLDKDKRIHTYSGNGDVKLDMFEVRGVYKDSTLDDVVRDYLLQADGKAVSDALLGPNKPGELEDILSTSTYYAVISIDSYEGLSDINQVFEREMSSIEVNYE